MLTYQGNVITKHTDVNNWIMVKPNYNPLNLPPNTVRVRTRDGVAPWKDNYGTTSYETATLVPGTTDVYDVYKSGTDFRYLLYKSTNVIEVLGANTSGITSMDEMFEGCTSLTSVALFDTSSVTNMRAMFYDSSINSVPLFDTSKVTNMSDMFNKCNSLSSVSLFDTSKVTNMGNMFTNCTSLSTVPLFNTSRVTNMGNMFKYCTLLQSVPLFNTHSVTDMSEMFHLCESLTTVPLFNTSNVTSMNNMFEQCESLTNIPLFNTSKVTNMDSMFQACRLVQGGALALYQQASSQANPPSSHYLTFAGCGSNTQTGSAELALIPSDWK